MSDLLENSIINIINNHYDFFLNKNNVNGIALGFKEINNKITNEPCLAVFVENKIPSKNLYKHEIVPKNFLGINTDIVQSPTPESLSTTIPSITIPFNSNLIRPIQPGYSIGVNAFSYGTLGAIVFDNDNNAPYILSNNHVLANSNVENIGTSILQPGAKLILSNEEGFSNITQNAIAYLYKKVIIKKDVRNSFAFNYVDCAIAKIFSTIAYNTEIYKIGKINGITNCKIGDEVKKTGATTEYTTGTVKYTNAFKGINNQPLGMIWYKDCIVCSSMSTKGDSGSLLLNLNNKAIGLLFAGSDDETILNPIDKVLNILNVHF